MEIEIYFLGLGVLYGSCFYDSAEEIGDDDGGGGGGWRDGDGEGAGGGVWKNRRCGSKRHIRDADIWTQFYYIYI